LLLGKTWDCVVLLDEADVFLEQRSLINLERNALVSVFLRVLEYYDGILILTSNRVGIFDEAFRSRVQLNLRYKNLDADQRRQIWENLINRIERQERDRPADSPAAGHSVDAADIKAHLDELAAPSLNGREIRNAISTARQLAMFYREPMQFRHLRSVIGEAKKFDDYLLELRDGFTADEIQRDKKER
jgi:SpoVK/Ycf46/Vps4 family AAA+-type ATPase